MVVVVVVVVAAVDGCADAASDDVDEVEQLPRHTQVDLQVSSPREFDGGVVFFDGVVRAADDVSAFAFDEVGLDGSPFVAAAAFVVDDPIAPLLFSFHTVDTDGGRSLLYLPVPGTHVTGNVSGNFLARSVMIEDDAGFAFAGAEINGVGLSGAPAAVSIAESTRGGLAFETLCGRYDMVALRFACGETRVLEMGESAELCGLKFTNHASFRLPHNRCEDGGAEQTIWTAVRP